jgi:hypothetical protein
VKKENKIQASLIKGINKLPGCKAIAIIVSGGMEVGTPDVFACIQGKMYVIETKRTIDDNPTPIQYRRLNEWLDALAYPVVLRGQKDVDYFLSRLTAEVHVKQRDDNAEITGS